MLQTGLVLEGGGMKGVYTAGVLDFFLDKGGGVFCRVRCFGGSLLHGELSVEAEKACL